MKYCLSTLQGGEDYLTVSKLYLVDTEMERLFNEDRDKIVDIVTTMQYFKPCFRTY